VRAKTLFASTRTTLVRELGRERFEGRGANLFVTDAREVLDVREWEERERVGGGGGAAAGAAAPLTEEERELSGVKRAEEEERYGGGGGTRGRDLMGSSGSGTGGSAGVKMKMDDRARKALAEMGERVGSEGGDGRVVQLVWSYRYFKSPLTPSSLLILSRVVHRPGYRNAHALPLILRRLARRTLVEDPQRHPIIYLLSAPVRNLDHLHLLLSWLVQDQGAHAVRQLASQRGECGTGRGRRGRQTHRDRSTGRDRRGEIKG
jgi:hypothetical protein